MAIEPVTREERFLAAAGGQSVTPPTPITRKEKLLQGIIDEVKSGGATPDVIENAVNNYLEANPVKPGATTEQVAQIEQNKTDIADLQEEIENKQPKGDYVKTVNGNKPDASGNVVVVSSGNGSGENGADFLGCFLELSENVEDAQANSDAITAAIANHKHVILKMGDYPVTGNIVIDSGHLDMNNTRLFVVDPNHSGHIVELRGEKPAVGNGEIEGCFHTPYGDPNYVWREDETCIQVEGVNDAYIYNMELHNAWGAGLATSHVYGERVTVGQGRMYNATAENTGTGKCTFHTENIPIPEGYAYVSAVGNIQYYRVISKVPARYRFYDDDGEIVSDTSDTPRIRIPIPTGAKTVKITTVCPTTEHIPYYVYFTNYRENITVENTLFRHCNQAGWNNPSGPSTIRNCGFLDIGKPYPEAARINPTGGWGIDIEDQTCPQFIMDSCWAKGCLYMLLFGGYNGTVTNCHGNKIGAYRGWNLMLSNCVIDELYTNSNGTDNIETHNVYAATLDIAPECEHKIHGEISTSTYSPVLTRFNRFTLTDGMSRIGGQLMSGRLVGSAVAKTEVGLNPNFFHPTKGSDFTIIAPGSGVVFKAHGDSWGITSDSPWTLHGHAIRDSVFTITNTCQFAKDTGVESSGLFENCKFDLAYPYFDHKQSTSFVPGQPTVLTFRDCTINNDGVYLFDYKPAPGSIITFERCQVSDKECIVNPRNVNLSDITIRFLDYSPEEYTVLTDDGTGYDYNIIIRDGALIPVSRASGIEITTPPTKTAYTVGETLDLSGMVISVVRQNGTKEEVSDYTAPAELPTDGVVVITYSEFGGTYSAMFTVTITEAETAE